MWVARDKDGGLFLYASKPSCDEMEGFWWVENMEEMFFLPPGFLPEIRWEDGPEEVVLEIKTKQGGGR